MTVIFRITRQSEKFRVDKRIFFMYYGLGCVTDFKDCFGLVCVACFFERAKRAIVKDPAGPNKKMIINYGFNKSHNREEDYRNLPYVKVLPCKLSSFETLLLRIDSIISYLRLFNAPD